MKRSRTSSGKSTVFASGLPCKRASATSAFDVRCWVLDVQRTLAIGPLALTGIIFAASLLLTSCSTPPPPVLTPIGAAVPAAAPTNAAAPVTPLPEGPIRITVMDAILQGLENNRALRVQRLGPALRRTFEQEREGVFDPVFSAQLSRQASKAEQPSGSGTGLTNSDVTTVSGSVGLSKTFATGTKVSLDSTTSLKDSSLYADEFDTTRGGVSVTQSLLRGGRWSANLASLRQARLDTLSSEYELRGYAEALVARIESTYWDYALAQRQIEIVTDSLKLAEQQLADTRERIAIGKTAQVELSAAEAEVAARQADLINARSALDQVRLHFLALLNPPGTNTFQREVALLEQPATPEARLDDVAAHVGVARRMRPDLNQARLAARRGTLEVVKTRNGVLPKLDLFINLGSSGYADSFGRSANRANGDFYDAEAGVALEYPLGNNDAEARNERARLGADQAAETLANMEQLVEVDVRSAYVEVQRAREEVTAVGVLVRRRQDAWRAETEKFGVNKSTTLLVAQAQRDLLAAQIQLERAVADHLKSFISLYRLEGSLLDRRAISAPGRDPAMP